MTTANTPIAWIATAAAASAAICMPLAHWLKLDQAFGIAAATATTVLAGFAFTWTDTHLARRAQRTGAANWTITLDGQTIGSIPNARYYGLWREVLAQNTTCLSQVGNAIEALADNAIYLLCAVPVACVWAVVAYMGLAPTSFFQSINALITMKASLAIQTSDMAINILTIIGAAMLIARWMWKPSLGLKNAYRQAMEQRIRAELDCDGAGSIEIHQETAGAAPMAAPIAHC